MRIVLWLALAASLYGGWQWWQKRSDNAAIAAIGAEPGPNGFVPAAMPAGTPRNVVLVLAPRNCPSEQAQRSEALLAALERDGIPVRRGNSIEFEAIDPTREDQAAIRRSIEVFKRGAPAVFVNGMAMSNPTPEQAIREYRRTRG